MQISLKKSARTWIIGALLIAFAWRALIPPGFMPKSGGLLAVEICHAGALAPLSHHGDNDSKGHVEHCLFAGAAAAPLAHSSLGTTFFAPVATVQADRETLPFPVQLVHIPEPRGPPPFS